MNSKKNLHFLELKIIESCELLRSHTSIREYKDVILPILYIRLMESDFNKNKKYTVEKTSFFYLFEKRYEQDFRNIFIRALSFLENDNDCLNDSFYTTIFYLRSNEPEINIVLAKIFEIFSSLPDDITIVNPGVRFEDDIFLNAIQFLSENDRAGAEYFTPIEICSLVARILSPKGGDRIYDPACGSGTLLLACVTEADKNSMSPCELYGSEKNASTWSLAAINLFLHGFRNAVFQNDSLRYFGKNNRRPQKGFDIAVSCPPWSMKNWGYEEFSRRTDLDDNIYQTLPPKSNGDYAFILELLGNLSNDGKGAIILPTGALSRGGAEQRIRERITSSNYVEAIISLPKKSFHHTNIDTSLIIFKMDKKHDFVFFINSREKQSISSGDQIGLESKYHDLIRTYQDEIQLDNYSRFVSVQEIASKNYDWGMSNYLRRHTDILELSDPLELRDERLKLNNQMEEINTTIDRYILEIVEKYRI